MTERWPRSSSAPPRSKTVRATDVTRAPSIELDDMVVGDAVAVVHHRGHASDRDAIRHGDLDTILGARRKPQYAAALSWENTARDRQAQRELALRHVVRAASVDKHAGNHAKRCRGDATTMDLLERPSCWTRRR